MKRENFTYPYEMAAIIVSYLRNEIDETEQQQLDVWLNSSENHKDLFSRICDERMQLEEIRNILSRNADNAWIVLKMKAAKRRRERLFRIYKVAASVVVLFSVSMVLWLKSSNKSLEGEKVAIHDEILPGRSIAKLTVASGVTYELDTLGDVLLSNSAVLNNGQEVVFKGLQEGKDSLYVPKYNAIETPLGGEYKLTLTDGTVVYMNSGTKLRFPEFFSEDGERVVYLSGEAFFKVAKDEHRPFIVKCSNYDVKVLGTSFNISNYADDVDSRTTLASGEVEICMNEEQILLEPGEQAIVTDKGVKVQEVDTELYTTWMYESFRFKGGSIDDIMKKLSRWYVVDVFYMNQSVKTFHFTGFLPRYAKIEDVLELLSYTTKNIAFEVKGKTVIVMKK